MATLRTSTIPARLIRILQESVRGETLSATGIQTNPLSDTVFGFRVARSFRLMIPMQFRTERRQTVSMHEDRSSGPTSARTEVLMVFSPKVQPLQLSIVQAR